MFEVLLQPKDTYVSLLLRKLSWILSSKDRGFLFQSIEILCVSLSKRFVQNQEHVCTCCELIAFSHCFIEGIIQRCRLRLAHIYNVISLGKHNAWNKEAVPIDMIFGDC